MLNILVACKEAKMPGGLAHAPEHRLLFSTAPGWSAAANQTLAAAAAYGGDALFLDDDTSLTPGCLEGVLAHYDQADIFGLDLHDMSGARQVGARHVMTHEGAIVDWVESGPAYVAHVSTSAVYIKSTALHLRFPVWDGVHWEDVAFCLSAWLGGLKVMAVPGRVDHAIAGGVGATKRHTPEFWAKWARNMGHFGAWCGEHGVPAALAARMIPIGAIEL